MAPASPRRSKIASSSRSSPPRMSARAQGSVWTLATGSSSDDTAETSASSLNQVTLASRSGCRWKRKRAAVSNSPMLPEGQPQPEHHLGSAKNPHAIRLLNEPHRDPAGTLGAEHPQP